MAPGGQGHGGVLGPWAWWGPVPVGAPPAPALAPVCRGRCAGWALAPLATLVSQGWPAGWAGRALSSRCCLQLELVLAFPCFPGMGSVCPRGGVGPVSSGQGPWGQCSPFKAGPHCALAGGCAVLSGSGCPEPGLGEP